MRPRAKKVVGLIGYPLQHSFSPLFQQAAFDYYSLPACYELWETLPEDLDGAVASLRMPDCLGSNVTIPYKEAVIPLLDALDEQAHDIGAVNTILHERGSLKGYNTDVQGFISSLEYDAGFEPFGKYALILGAGGVARAAAIALLRAGAARLVICNRHVARGQSLVDFLAAKGTQVELSALSCARQDLAKALAGCDLVVNATSVGMKHGSDPGGSLLPPDLIPEDALVFDLVYNPTTTPLLRDAQARGARVLNGLPMLVYQGAAAFELWTGQQAPVGLMFERLKRVLEEC
ncbi:MAG: shikimate dehydrogenase [Chloroflexi bacterium]|nr:shikimate dehydrogenase [Chloroflexota bacterium]